MSDVINENKLGMRVALITLFILVIKVSIAQSFEGKVVLESSTKSLVQEVSDPEFNAILGTKQEYYIKGDKYKSISNGTFSPMQIYVPSEMRIYREMGHTDTLYWDDAKDNPYPVESFEIEETETEILGYQCKRLTLNVKDGKEVYYFNSSSLRVKPKDYKNHKYGNWFFVISKTKSLPLRTEVHSKDFILVFEAVNIEPMKLEDDIFILPDAPKIRNPIALN